MMKVGILVYKHCTASMVVGMLDILSLANLQSPDSRHPLFDVCLISSDGQPVNSFASFPIQVTHSMKSSLKYDIIYIPGFLADPETVITHERDTIGWLIRQHKKGTKLVAACNGNLLIAETGLMEGRAATTHWNLKDFFEHRYPNVCLMPEKIIVDEGDIISAAGVTSYTNLALYLIAKFGSIEIAQYCAKIFLLDSGRKLQTPYLIFNSPKSHGDQDILKIQQLVEENYQNDISVESLLTKVPMGRRTLLRRFKHATGDTPIEYLQRIRIENAKRFLEITDKTFSQITWDVGYRDVSSFQRLFKSSTGLTPREYRNKFSLTPTPRAN